ncbi:MAG TPA: class I SAM-dependent methyltransferase [Reyranella sp.]|nr:class I SAM-dependent methyltransferase [Reyranella sp.]
MADDGLYRDPELAQFYDLENGWDADLDYCGRLAAGCASVLDLGCGTGQFAATLAGHGVHDVVGVDPAQAMLDIAATRPDGKRVQWVAADARTARLGRAFELIVLTGHAFQVFLTDDDRAAVLRTIAMHLAPAGRFIFDSRNPADEAWKRWTPERSRRRLAHPSLGPVVAWNDAKHDPATGVVTYDTHYEIVADGRRHAARTQIAFPTRRQIASQIEAAGLAVHAWLGDWSGAPCTADARVIVVLGGVAPAT